VLIFSLCLSVLFIQCGFGFALFCRRAREGGREGGKDGINIYIYGDEEGENLDCLLAIYRKIK